MLETYNTYHPDLKEECGVCGVFAHRDSAHLVYLGLTSLQHRGQELLDKQNERLSTA